MILLWSVLAVSLLQVFGEPLQGEKVGQLGGYGKNNEREILGRENYPYMIYLEIHYGSSRPNEVNFCGGILIRGRVVLTAAHCLKEASSDLRVYAIGGILNLAIERRAAKVIQMYDYLVHERYDTFVNKKGTQSNEIIEFPNDIALVWLKEHFRYGPKINQIDLLQTDEKLWWKEGFILGWGQMADGKCSYMLRIGNQTVVPNSFCDHITPKKHSVLGPGMLCIVADNGVSQNCRGDSGGPLVIGNKLAGVISSSIKKKVILPDGRKIHVVDASQGAVVSSVPYYYKWITDNIKKGPPKDRKVGRNRPDQAGSSGKNTAGQSSSGGKNTGSGGKSTGSGGKGTVSGGKNTGSGGKGTVSGGKNTGSSGKSTGSGGKSTPNQSGSGKRNPPSQQSGSGSSGKNLSGQPKPVQTDTGRKTSSGQKSKSG